MTSILCNRMYPNIGKSFKIHHLTKYFLCNERNLHTNENMSVSHLSKIYILIKVIKHPLHVYVYRPNELIKVRKQIYTYRNVFLDSFRKRDKNTYQYSSPILNQRKKRDPNCKIYSVLNFCFKISTFFKIGIGVVW